MSEFFGHSIKIFAVISAVLAAGVGVVWAVIYYVFFAVQSQVLGKTVWCGNAENNFVALTFDDGPAPETLEILDCLREENVKATFFLIGKNVEKYPEIARRIIAENHEIGNHSYSHPIYFFRSSRRTRRELEMTQEIIKKVTGIEPKVSRPPCGVRSQAYFEHTKKLGLQTIQWSDTGYDWEKISAEQITEKVLETVQSDSIILLHDGDSAGKQSRRVTVKALPAILHGLREKNLRVVPLSEICPDIYEGNLNQETFSQSFESRKQL